MVVDTRLEEVKGRWERRNHDGFVPEMLEGWRIRKWRNRSRKISRARRALARGRSGRLLILHIARTTTYKKLSWPDHQSATGANQGRNSR